MNDLMLYVCGVVFLTFLCVVCLVLGRLVERIAWNDLIKSGRIPKPDEKDVFKSANEGEMRPMSAQRTNNIVCFSCKSKSVRIHAKYDFEHHLVCDDCGDLFKVEA